MNANRNPIETQSESGEARNLEQQALDDASIEPTAVVESAKDYQGAETIQANLTAAVESAEPIGATPLPIPHTAQEVGATPLPIPQPEDNSVLGRIPAVPADAKFTIAEKDDGRNKATPITLPGQQEPVDATPIPLPGPEAAAAAPAKTAGTSGKDLSIPIRQGKIINDPLSRESAGGQKSGDSAPAAGENATAAEPQEGKPVSDKGQAIKTGEGKTIQQPAGKLGPGNVGAAKIPGPERILPELAADARNLIGMGAHGMLDGAGPQKAIPGKIKGYGPGTYGDTHSTKGTSFGKDGMPGNLKPGTSGGSHGVHGYGPGMAGAPTGGWNGNTFITGWVKGIDGKTRWCDDESKDSGYVTMERALDQALSSNAEGGSGSILVSGKGGNWSITWGNGNLVMYKWNTVDGGSPIPYTGGAAQGAHPKPQTIGGKNVESGHYTPLVSVDGKVVSGGGSSGDPGTEWDEGHWYGGLFGSAGRPNNPDDPDYYTPNVLDQADKAKKSSS